MVAAGAAWESRALGVLADEPDVMVLKRCVDVDDLLAVATAGQAEVAVVGLDAPGLDAPAVDHLHRHGVRPVAVAPGSGPAGAASDAARLHASRIGVATLIAEGELAALPEAVATDEGPDPDRVDGDAAEDPEGRPGGRHRVVVVWGPRGAPGRTTVACALAGELATRGRPTVLVDADPRGGTVAQQLGVLDEVSGLLSAARLSVAGVLEEGFGGVQRRLRDHLTVVTGLPRADRYVEVRPGVVEHLLETAARESAVVVDVGSDLDDERVGDPTARPGRSSLTLEALGVADEVVVVGAADPVGLSRLARGLVELREVTGGRPVRVVVNRNRSTLGWSEREVAGMVEGFARVSGLHFLPDDRAAVDRALVAGRELRDGGDSPLVRAVAGLADAVLPEPAPARRRGIRRRRGARARRR
jgi:MinD-like ATPase involved in chromosome partitioning or flagellar assembly